MNQLKCWTHRITMTVLFFMALLVTFQTISGVDAQSFIIGGLGTENKQGDDKGMQLTHNLKPVEIAFKEIKRILQLEQLISSSKTVSGTPQALEDAFDWSQYPKKTVIATGYTAGYESTGKNEGHPEYGITYSGVKVKRDLFSTVAADLNVFPIGTILFIPDYGYGVVADKGGAIKGNKLDLYYETVDDVYSQWGKRNIEVYVIEQGNGKITEEQLRALNEDKAMQVFRQRYIRSESR